MGRLVQIILVLALLMILLVIAAGILLYVVSDGQPVTFVQREITRLALAGRQDELQRPIGSDNRAVRFTVNPGDTPPVVAQNLYTASLIGSPDLFVDYAFVSGLDVEMEAGVYFPNQTLTIPQIAQMLTDSRSSSIPFRILEGWRMEEVADAIDRNGLFGFSGADFLAAVGPGTPFDTMLLSQFSNYVALPPGSSLEGFLFPDTYQLPPQITAPELRDHLLQAFLDHVGPDIQAGAAQQGLSIIGIVTLASIVERESVHADENARIAGVYRNRLNIGMKLDADPTVQYGIGFKDGTWWPQITQEDYHTVDSAYNTYLTPGTPPRPIANPGLAAITAAAYPEQHDFLYFRAACDGSGYHVFARTYEEHLANGC